MQTGRLHVPVDGSQASFEAARLAIDLAARWGSRVRAVYVVEQPDLDGADADTVARLRESGRSILARIVELARQRGVPVEEALFDGVPFEVILDDATRWNADVIVMGRTGRTGPGRALLGSEAERVLEFTDRPVLIVPSVERGGDG